MCLLIWSNKLAYNYIAYTLASNVIQAHTYIYAGNVFHKLNQIEISLTLINYLFLWMEVEFL
jgi:hypothetical protein